MPSHLFSNYDADDDAGPEAVHALHARLSDIAEDLKADRYRIGSWQDFVVSARRAPIAARVALTPQINAVSQLIHARRRPRTYPLGLFTSLEMLGLLGGLAALCAGVRDDSILLLVVSAVLLVLTLQPLLKASAGRLLGIRFTYGYTAKGEPRYKLAYGTYLAAPFARRFSFHLAGTIGSVAGLVLVGAASLASHPSFGSAMLGLAIPYMLIQVLFFLAVLGGRSRLPGIGLIRFSSAGAAAEELRARRHQKTQGA